MAIASPYGIVYALCDPEGNPEYVGQTVNPAARLATHLRTAREDSPKYPVHRWIKKLDGRVTMKVLATSVSRDELNDLEIAWIADLRKQGFASKNLADGGAIGYWPVGEDALLAKLTQDQAMEILDLAATTDLSFPRIGAMFNVTGGAAYAIAVGISWKHLERAVPAKRRRQQELGDDMVRQIIDRVGQGAKISDVASTFDCSITTVWEIANNQTYRHISRPPGFYDGYHRGKRMDAEKVRQIRELSAEGVGTAALSRRFQVSATTIKKIKNRESWAHIE